MLTSIQSAGVTPEVNLRITQQWRIQDFPDGGHQPPRWERQPTILPSFYQKLHENERIWTLRGEGHASLAPPPLRSANAQVRKRVWDPPWLWNPGQMSPQVKNRGISGPQKRTCVLQNFFLIKGNKWLGNLVTHSKICQFSVDTSAFFCISQIYRKENRTRKESWTVQCG